MPNAKTTRSDWETIHAGAGEQADKLIQAAMWTRHYMSSSRDDAEIQQKLSDAHTYIADAVNMLRDAQDLIDAVELKEAPDAHSN